MRKNSQILLDLLKVGGIITVSVLAPGATPILKPFFRDERFDYRNFRRTIYRMYKNELISVSEEGKELTLRLEKKGKEKAIKYSIDEMEIKKPKKWDGKWRIVIFDIPEEEKNARNILKKKLDALGFRKIQKSVYVHPFPCEDEIEFIRSVYGVRSHVDIILAEKLEYSDHFRRHFELS